MIFFIVKLRIKRRRYQKNVFNPNGIHIILFIVWENNAIQKEKKYCKTINTWTEKRANSTKKQTKEFAVKKKVTSISQIHLLLVCGYCCFCCLMSWANSQKNWIAFKIWTPCIDDSYHKDPRFYFNWKV